MFPKVLYRQRFGQKLPVRGTDTGLNFFYPGKTEEGAKLFVTGIACLSYGLAKYNAPWTP